MAADYESAVDSEMSTFWGLNYDTFIDSFLEKVNLKNGDIILDLATGTAVIPRKLAARTGNQTRIIGLDITYRMVNTAHQIIQPHPHYSRMELTCGNAMAIPIASSSLNAVTCALATHHMNAAVLVGEIYRVLKPGGFLYITDVGYSSFLRLPVIGSLVKAAAYLYFLKKQSSSRAKTEMDAVQNVLTPDEWEQTLQQTGYQEISVEKIRSKFFWVPPPVQISAKKL